VLTVRAYTAADARNINAMLLELGERLVNKLNERSQRDLIDVAEQEVRQAEARTKAAALALSSFRASRSVFDPTAQSGLQLQGVAKLQEELLDTEAQLAQLRLVAPKNPQIESLANHAEVVRKAIASETGKVVGDGASLTAKTPLYDRLTLEMTFADHQLASALAALEEARLDAARKRVYLERLVQPNLPDNAMEPRRLRSVVVVFLLGLVAWAVIRLVVSSVREHVD